jgi:glutamate-1-semialdehyde aminotransferase
MAERCHPVIGERLLKSVLLLEGVSVRSGLGAISTAHDEADLDKALEATAAALARFRAAGLA